MTLKVCTKCKQSKPLSEFHKSKGVKSAKNGLRPSCKKCEALRNKRYRQTAAGYRVNKEKHYKARYGITLNDRLSMYVSQNGKCACCGDLTVLDRIVVDHNHKTGKLRALLCWNCNVGLGFFKDNFVRLQKAIDYLSKYDELAN